MRLRENDFKGSKPLLQLVWWRVKKASGNRSQSWSEVSPLHWRNRTICPQSEMWHSANHWHSVHQSTHHVKYCTGSGNTVTLQSLTNLILNELNSASELHQEHRH